jgi:hypothetical protein
MFNSTTVIVVGAGASEEAGLPTGGGLVPIIRKKVNFSFGQSRLKSGNSNLWEALRIHANNAGIDANEYLKAGRRIHDGITLTNSIDDFMDMHRNDERIQLCGKAAIIQSILGAERRSKLSVDRRHSEHPNLDNLDTTWFVKFFRVLRVGVSLENLSSLFDRITFVSFNYDRCVEQFLYHAVRLAYSVDHETALEVCENATVLHPYGSAGRLFSRHNPNVQPVAFGAVINNLISFSNRIRTYTEEIKSAVSLNAIREAVSSARTMVFLGFAFHRQNMELLKVPTSRVMRVLGTVKGFSNPDKEAIEDLIVRTLNSSMLMRKEINLINKSCSELFSEYSRTISEDPLK